MGLKIYGVSAEHVIGNDTRASGNRRAKFEMLFSSHIDFDRNPDIQKAESGNYPRKRTSKRTESGQKTDRKRTESGQRTDRKRTKRTLSSEEDKADESGHVRSGRVSTHGIENKIASENKMASCYRIYLVFWPVIQWGIALSELECSFYFEPSLAPTGVRICP